MLNLDPAKLLVIAVVAIILLGPDRLPQVARQVGAAWRSFNEFRHRMESEVRSTMPDLPSSAEIARLARSPSALLNHLSNMSDSPSTNGDAQAVADHDANADDAADADADGVVVAGAETAAAADAEAEPVVPDPPTSPPAAEPPTPPTMPSYRPAAPAARDEARNGTSPATPPAPHLVPPVPGVVAPGDPTLN